jgi:predicted HicB family RNase H-like nuclease
MRKRKRDRSQPVQVVQIRVEKGFGRRIHIAAAKEDKSANLFVSDIVKEYLDLYYPENEE